MNVIGQPQTMKPGELWPGDRDKHIQAHGGGVIKLVDTFYWFSEDCSRPLDIKTGEAMVKLL